MNASNRRMDGRWIAGSGRVRPRVDAAAGPAAGCARSNAIARSKGTYFARCAGREFLQRIPVRAGAVRADG
jgi:hypothetical protein